MSLKAIVVDDEQLAREELCYMLEQMGSVEVIAQAGNGLEAVGIVERLTPDVLFLDVQMPVMDGLESIRRIREWEARSGRARIPIHIVSANGDCDADAAGADGFIPKPVSVRQILEAVQPYFQPIAEAVAPDLRRAAVGA